MSLVEENKDKIGFGSWYYSLAYNDTMPFENWQNFTKDICALRLMHSGIKKGDNVEIVKVGGDKPIKYRGTVVRLGKRELVLQQTKRELILDIWGIDDIKLLKNQEPKYGDKVTEKQTAESAIVIHSDKISLRRH